MAREATEHKGEMEKKKKKKVIEIESHYSGL